MLIHPFKPQIPVNAKKLLIGTLPPENVSYYFSNSVNNRLWDILTAIKTGADQVGSGGYKLNANEKFELLASLKVGLTDIIYGYQRDEPNSTQDSHINPLQYNDVIQLALSNNIEELLFVYQSAWKWFLHSMQNQNPTRLNKLPGKYLLGPQENILIGNKTIKCTLLPSPLSRGRKGETLNSKLTIYRKYILG